MMNLKFQEVVSHSDWRRFIDFPNKLFKNEPLFIPSLDSDEKDSLYLERNPAYEYCDAKFWMAMRDGDVVGRVGAIINKKANEKWNCRCVRFGWMDFIEDFEVCKALLDKVIEFGRQHGMNRIQGPMGFTDIDKECWVIEGFENEQNFTTIYNPKYYIDYVERLGFKIDCKWKQYRMDGSQPIPERVMRINELIRQKYNVRLLEFTRRKDLFPYGHQLFETLNDSFGILYGFVPLNQVEIDRYVKKYFTFIDPELVKLVVDENDRVIAFAIAYPSMTKAFKKIGGKMFPFGWIHALRALKKYDTIDLLLNGVRQEWQGKGIHALYHAALNRTMIEKGVKVAYTNPQIIGNNAVMVWDAQYKCEEQFVRAVFAKEL